MQTYQQAEIDYIKELFRIQLIGFGDLWYQYRTFKMMP